MLIGCSNQGLDPWYFLFLCAYVRGSADISIDIYALSPNESQNAQLDTSAIVAFSHFAYTVIHANALSASSSSPWIINSGATDHLACFSNLFSFYSTCDKLRVPWIFVLYFCERFK